MTHGFTLPSFAKINLVLRILGKRKDDYHTLETIFQTLELHDDLVFQFSPSQSFHVSLDVKDSSIPADSTNLIYKACKAFHEVHPLRHKVEVSIEKRIPVQSGLGGGSSNAAVTLVALSRLYDWPVNRRVLLECAKKLGADVPYFLYGGTAFGTGRGERISLMADLEPAPVLLVLPDLTCSTAVVYRKYDEMDLLTPPRNSIKITLDQRPESLRDVVSLIENDLERVVFAIHPELDSIKKRLVEQGAVAASLTGSGSALFGLFTNAVDRDRAVSAFSSCEATRFLGRQEYRKQLGIPERRKPVATDS